MVEGQAALTSSMAEVMFRKVDTLHIRDDATTLLDAFSRDSVGLVVDDNQHLIGILTKMDLVEHLTQPVSTS